MPKHVINIDVLGCSLPISADEEPEYLSGLLETYRQKLEEIEKNTGLKDPLKKAVLTGFLLCDECEKIRLGKNSPEGIGGEKNPEEDSGEDSIEAENLTLSLISRLGVLLGLEDTEDVYKETKIYKLQNIIKNYDWGSPDWIPDLLDRINVSQMPWAELWMGSHPEGPSKVIDIFEGENVDSQSALLLPELISRDKELYLGKTGFDTLPFLFKVIAAEKPLSIQTHPSLEQALEGWARESGKGIGLDSPLRNYRDKSHKPEIICAISPFIAMAGFREPIKIKALLAAFFENASRSLKAAVFPLITALEEKEDPLKKFLSILFSMPEKTRKDFCDYAKVLCNNAREETKLKEWDLIEKFAELYPEDPTIISPLYLNIVNLEPGDALFIPSGILHAYVHGMGLELMANSNNVLRGGLTNKHIDIPELLKILDFKPFNPVILKENPEENFYKYPVSCREFSLSILKGGEIPYL